jgi:peroxiredoxin
MELQGRLLPDVVFKTRVRDESVGGDNPYRWEDVTTEDLFANKRVVVFSLPGAFTPTCSTYQVPGFEEAYECIKSLHVDDVYCVSVNDAFVMNAWAKAQGVENIKMIPDGSGKFTAGLNMLVEKDNLGFGNRSWRYAMLVTDGVIEKSFVEPGQMDNCPEDPYGETSPESVIAYLESVAERFAVRSETKDEKAA